MRWFLRIAHPLKRVISLLTAVLTLDGKSRCYHGHGQTHVMISVPQDMSAWSEHHSHHGLAGDPSCVGVMVPSWTVKHGD